MDTNKGVGLIKRIKQGQGKPTRIYVLRFTTQELPPQQEAKPEPEPPVPLQEVVFTDLQKSDFPTQRGRDFRPQQVEKNDPNQTNKENTAVYNRGDGRASREVREESRKRLYPTVFAYAACAAQPYPYNGSKERLEGIARIFPEPDRHPSASAFIQQRQKLLPSALAELFRRFTDFLEPGKDFRGYRLLAVDGTSLKGASYPEDADSYRPGTQRQHGWNLYHINALFDLCSGIYTDMLVQKEHTKSESRALCELAGRSAISEPVILLADRGYEAYNNFSHLEKRGWKYLIRLRDQHRTRAYGVTLPDLPQFDIPVRLTLGRLSQRQLKQRDIPVPEAYCTLPPFDLLEPSSSDFYTFSVRIVRLRLKDGSTQILITNLDKTQFPPAILRSLYARRWGIETSFWQLKYTVGMVHLHSKKPELSE